MSDNLIRCVHENGKVCFLTKAATENRAFMKKYGIRVEHVQKKSPVLSEVPAEVLPEHFIPREEVIESPEPTNEAEAEAIDQQVADALAEAAKPVKPKQTRKPRKPTKR